MITNFIWNLELEELIEKCTEVSGSDIHFIPKKEYINILIRTPSDLIELSRISLEEYIVFLQKLKIRSGMNISEKRLPQDGIIKVNEKEVRVSTLKGIYGEALTLRLFLSTNKSLSELGFNKVDENKIISLLKGNFSLLLITGQTGSGKSTTLKAIEKYLLEMNKKVISIEDPVEIRVDGALEISINESIEFTYERAIFASLRQDPDYIFIGEIRNIETCDAAIKAALSGHSVISTFHSGDYEMTKMRLMSMSSYKDFIEPVLSCTINQKLVNENGNRKLIAKVEINGY